MLLGGTLLIHSSW